ncbi:MAG: hypothetical protein WC523_04555 [Patescibacteria group bacterium]
MKKLLGTIFALVFCFGCSDKYSDADMAIWNMCPSRYEDETDYQKELKAKNDQSVCQTGEANFVGKVLNIYTVFDYNTNMVIISLRNPYKSDGSHVRVELTESDAYQNHVDSINIGDIVSVHGKYNYCCRYRSTMGYFDTSISSRQVCKYKETK